MSPYNAVKVDKDSMQSRLSSRLKLSRSKSLLLAVSAQALMLGYLGCSSGGGGGTTTPMGGSGGTAAGGMTTGGGSGGTTAMGGNVTGGGNTTGGTAPIAGSGGTPVGVGGMSGGTPGVGGTGGMPAGGGGGSGGMPGAGGMAAACATTPGTVDAGLNLTMNDPALGARAVAATPAGNMMRIRYDKTSQKIFALNQDGNIWIVDPVANTVMPANTGFQPPAAKNCRSMTFGPDGTMYVQCHNGGGTSVNIQKGTPGAGGAYTWSTLVTTAGFPTSNTNFDHGFNGLIVSPDGMNVIFGSGSRTDHGEDHGGVREVPLSSAIFTVPASSNNLMIMNDATSAQYLYADGTRNTFDLAYNAAGDLFGAENGPDMDLPDEINFLEQGKHYGFPWRMGSTDNPVMDPAYSKAANMCLQMTGLQAVATGTYDAYDAGFVAKPTGVTFTDPVLNHGPDSAFYFPCPGGGKMTGSAGMPLAGISGHKSPLGLNFDKAGELCGQYHNAGFFVTYGAVSGGPFGDGGQDLNLMIPMKVGAAYEMEVHQLVAGFGAPPIDATLVGNKLYIVEYGNGSQIIEITLPVAM
jgi:hypothetical protein